MIHGVRLEQIEKELAMAEAAMREANEGKARVCARRAVALAAEASLERFPQPGWRGDAMHHLRQITTGGILSPTHPSGCRATQHKDHATGHRAVYVQPDHGCQVDYRLPDPPVKTSQRDMAPDHFFLRNLHFLTSAELC